MFQVRTALFRERAKEIKLNLHHLRLRYQRYFELKTRKVVCKCVQHTRREGWSFPGWVAALTPPLNDKPPLTLLCLIFSRSLSKRTFPSCITHQKRLKDPLSLSPTSRDVAPCTPGNADVGSRRGGTRSRAGAGPSTLGDPPASWRRDAGKAAQAGGEPRSDWRRGGVSLDRSRGRKDCHWGQRAATRA